MQQRRKGPVGILVGCSVIHSLLQQIGVRNVVHDPRAYDIAQSCYKGQNVENKPKSYRRKKANRDGMSDSDENMCV